MTTKLIAALLATVFAAAAHAEQQYGRDSVYGGKGASVGEPSTGPVITRYGRDSVYAVSGSARSAPAKVVGDVTFKAGRA
ncbi:MAG: hypothetical protein ABI612_19435 [Betaproteobacteria bacterium]